MLPPDVIIHNRYRVNSVLDERPGSWLYRGRDDQTGRFVLIGALPADSDEAREDLALVAGQIATVRNDALIPLTEHFAEGDRYYLVCDDPGGQDLERTLRIRGGPLPEATVLPQAIWLLGALEYLHGQRPPLYIGDPTPNDVWIGEDGSWRLTPFALARAIGQMPSPYRAPELAEPHADMTAASDLYAVGALLYQTLTGMPPTSAEQQAAGAPLIGPRSLNPAITLLGEQALLRALQLRSVNRYQAAREMRTAIETIHMMGGRSLGLGPDVINSPAVSQAPAQPAPPVYSRARASRPACARRAAAVCPGASRRGRDAGDLPGATAGDLPGVGACGRAAPWPAHWMPGRAGDRAPAAGAERLCGGGAGAAARRSAQLGDQLQ